MSDRADENEPKIDRMMLAEELLKEAEGVLAQARNSHKNRYYAESMREAMDSIEFSTQLMRLLLGMDFEHELPGSAWFGQLVGAIPPQTVDDETAERYKRIAGELFHATEMALDRIKKST